MIWFTSDHHFSHARIILLDERPFKSIQEHDAELIRLWNETVKPGDTVYHLGDFSFGPLHRQISIASRLNGDIILIRGNHDGSMTRMQKIFKTVIKKDMALDFHGRKVLLRHRPYHYPKEQDTSGQYDWVIHGHTHKSGQQVRGRMINVNVMFWNWRPVSEFEILSIMEEGEKTWIRKLLRKLWTLLRSGFSRP